MMFLLFQKSSGNLIALILSTRAPIPSLLINGSPTAVPWLVISRWIWPTIKSFTGGALAHVSKKISEGI